MEYATVERRRAAKRLEGRRNSRRRYAAKLGFSLDSLPPVPERCEACGRAPKTKALALDHCHVTGRFRGWLCTQCNAGIGLLGDSVKALARAMVYLKRAELRLI